MKKGNKEAGSNRREAVKLSADISSGNIHVDFSDKKKNSHLLLSAFILTVLILFSFRNVFDNSFVDFDDFTYVVNNDLVRDTEKTTLKDVFTTPVSSNYHPVTILTMRMNANECRTCPNGISPLPFVRTNVFIHILNTILVLLLIYMLSNGSIIASFVAAAIFGIHPMHVESVAWISERKDVLYSFFFLSGLIAFINYKKGTSRKYIWLGITFLLFILSCLSKATAVVFPLVLLLINYWYSEKDEKSGFAGFIRNLFPAGSIYYLVPFFLGSLFFGLMAYHLQNGENFLGILELGKIVPDVVDAAGPFTLWQKITTGCFGFIIYIVKFIAPVRLSAFYPYPGTVELQNGLVSFIRTISPAILLLLVIVVIISMRKTRLFAFGAGFYLITVILVLQIIPVGYAIIADRYSYLPYIGISFIAGALIAHYSERKKYLIAIAGGCILFFSFLSARQADVWDNTEALWTNVIEKFPRVEIAHRSRAKYYSKAALSAKNGTEKKMLEDKALADFMEAIKSESKNTEVYEGVGVIYGTRGDKDNAMRYFAVALKLDPKNGSVYYNRALTLSNMNRREEAITDYSRALEFSPEKKIKILTNRSNLYLETGKFREAIADLDELIRLDNSNFLFYYNRAVSRQAIKDLNGALSDFQRALTLNSRDQITATQIQNLNSFLKLN
ncbi:MAG: tetratricopeptide repeat protein [Methanosarcina sp.]